MSRLAGIVALAATLGFAIADGPALAGGDTMMMKKAHGGTVAAPSGPVHVDKATGADAHTVAELHAKGAALAGKKIAVRGKVVKVSRSIMNRNWVHLQDGSGDAAKGTHDVVVTTQDSPEVGDVVTARGVLAKDKDFGAGYVYAVIVEEATVKK
ncbi:MAG: hypothetical protein ACM3NF_06905 [Gemmatimonadota bacterium]